MSAVVDEERAWSEGDEDEGELGDGEIAPRWYCVPVWRLWLFTLLGGWLYQVRYQYCAWRAYRRSFGYSRQREWQAVKQRTGFRVSPFWRAVLGIYVYALLVVVWREARLAGVRRFGLPVIWASMHVAAVVLSWFPVLWTQLILSLALLPLQATVNAIADKASGQRHREPVEQPDLIVLLVGGIGLAVVLFQRGWY